MNNIIINQSSFLSTKAGINIVIQTEISDVNETYYKKLKALFSISKGKYVKQMQLQVEKEYQLFAALADLYKNTLTYIQEAANQAIQLDQQFAVPDRILEDGHGKIK